MTPTPDPLHERRSILAGCFEELHRAGLPEVAEEVARSAAAAGIWPGPLQQPARFLDGLRSRAWWPAEEFEACRWLEEAAAGIQRELAEVEGGAPPGLVSEVTDEIYSGRWEQLVFRSTAGQSPAQVRALDRYPVTADVLQRIASEGGPARGAMVCSTLHPGTHVRPHCGATNGRLRIHFCLEADRQARIRVGTEWRTWEAGRCLVLDESFVHEVVHEGTRPRKVLIVDIAHPDLEPVAVDLRHVTIDPGRAMIESISAWMEEASIDRITRGDDRSLRFRMVDPLVAALGRQATSTGAGP